MIGLDTNILVRYLTQDDARQSKRATDIVEKELSSDWPGFVSSVVLIEVCWVLSGVYKVKKEDVMFIVMELLNAEDLQIEHHEETWKAHRLAVTQGLDFSDALIGMVHQAYGCEYTLTFDKKAAKGGVFKLA
jgi:predicted nucleic-acid-binding protein